VYFICKLTIVVTDAPQGISKVMIQALLQENSIITAIEKIL